MFRCGVEYDGYFIVSFKVYWYSFFNGKVRFGRVNFSYCVFEINCKDFEF